MAKIKEEFVVLKVSSLVKDGDDHSGLVTEELVGALESVASDLFPNAIVEVTSGE